MKTTLLLCTLALCATAIYCAHKLAPPRYSVVSVNEFAYAVDQKTGQAYLLVTSEIIGMGLLADEAKTTD